jgi:3-hydroxybutyryl-CoA dehydratase
VTVLHVEIGDKVQFAKTVSESDVYLFAGITGDFSGNHVNEEFMRSSVFGRRIAHGALLVGFMSTTSTMMIERSLRKGIDSTPVSLGYDRVRFLKPVFMGDTVTVCYEIAEIDTQNRRTKAVLEVTNQMGEVVAVAEHILKWVVRAESAELPEATTTK